MASGATRVAAGVSKDCCACVLAQKRLNMGSTAVPAASLFLLVSYSASLGRRARIPVESSGRAASTNAQKAKRGHDNTIYALQLGRDSREQLQLPRQFDIGHARTHGQALELRRAAFEVRRRRELEFWLAPLDTKPFDPVSSDTHIHTCAKI